MRVIIHAGTPKTGTTAIQGFFAHNSDRLLDEFGIRYPSKGRGAVRRAHHNIAYQYGGAYLRGKFDPRKGGLREALAEALSSKAEVCLLSSEAFYHVAQRGLRQLARDLADYQTIVVLYLRRQDAYLQSGYQQVFKLGGTLELPVEFCTRKLSIGRYDKHVERFHVAFGSSNVLVRRFETRASGFDVRRDICDLLGLEFAKLRLAKQAPQSSNSTLGLKGLSFLRSLIVSGQISPLRKPESAFFQKVINYFRTEGRDSYDFSLLTYEEAKALCVEYSQSNHRLAQLVGWKGDADFFRCPPTESEYPGLPKEVHYTLHDRLFMKTLCLRYGLRYTRPRKPAELFHQTRSVRHEGAAQWQSRDPR